jgi:hypothetical protein
VVEQLRLQGGREGLGRAVPLPRILFEIFHVKSVHSGTTFSVSSSSNLSTM